MESLNIKRHQPRSPVVALCRRTRATHLMAASGPIAEADHDVSMLIALAGAGRWCGEEARTKVSMMIVPPPQHGQVRDSGFVALVPADVA